MPDSPKARPRKRQAQTPVTDEKRAGAEFSLERAKALDAYAQLEQSLALLFHVLLGTPKPQQSYAVFGKILIARARQEVLLDLMDLWEGEKYDVFFRSLIERLSKLDSIRNKIVHWIVLERWTNGTILNPAVDIALHPHPDMFREGRLIKHDLVEFRQKTRFIHGLFYYFALHLWHGDQPALESAYTWHEIFQKPVRYPPQKDHPLYRKYKEQ